MGVTPEQAYLLNTLTYMSKNAYSAKAGDTVESFVQGLLSSPNNINAITCRESFMTENEIRSTCEQILADNKLGNMEIAYADRTVGGADRIIFTAENAAGEKEAIVAFEGTMGGNEWRDNFIAGAKTDQDDGVSSFEQENTLNWFQNDPNVQVALLGCESITVSGHSKGGNKAKHLTLHDSRIDACISFDGQGFSDDYVKCYEDEIRKNQGKIQNYNHKSDFVNLLLNDVGEIHFIEGRDCGDNVALNHSLFSLGQGMPFAQNETAQWEPMAELDQLINGFLRTLNETEKKNLLGLIAELAADFMETDKKWTKEDGFDYAYRLIFDQGFILFAQFIDYVIAYGGAELCDMLGQWIKENFPWMSGLINIIQWGVEQAVGLKDGSDIRYESYAAAQANAHVAGSGGRLEMDTDELRSLSEQLSTLQNALNGCAQQVEHAALLCNEYALSNRLSVGLRLKMTGGGTKVFAVTPAQALQGIRMDMYALGAAIGRLSDSVTKTAICFEENETRIAGLFSLNTGSPAEF